jgi:hypothetical protein
MIFIDMTREHAAASITALGRSLDTAGMAYAGK